MHAYADLKVSRQGIKRKSGGKKNSIYTKKFLHDLNNFVDELGMLESLFLFYNSCTISFLKAISNKTFYLALIS